MTEKGQVIGDACPGSGGLAGAVYLKTAATHPGVCKRLMLVYQKLALLLPRSHCAGTQQASASLKQPDTCEQFIMEVLV